MIHLLLVFDIAAKKHPSTIFRTYGVNKMHKKYDLLVLADF